MPSSSGSHGASVHDPDAMRRRLLDGLAAQVGVSPDEFALPGVSVVGRDDRAGTGAVACYRVDQHLVLWADPEVVDALPTATELLHLGGGPVPNDAMLTEALAAAGFEFVTGGVMCTLVEHRHGSATVAPPNDGSLVHRQLRADDPAHVAMIRTLLDRSDPADIELAGLDELGDLSGFDEVAINVVIETTGSSIVAYSSAMDWGWDAAFADIAVLVDGAHRGRGLAAFVASRTVDDLLALGRLPLYRHTADNVASARVAASLGFTAATTLTFHRRTS